MLPSMSCDLRVGVSESDVLVLKAGFEINFLRITKMDCDWLGLALEFAFITAFISTVVNTAAP